MTQTIPWAEESSYSGVVGGVPEETDKVIVFLHGNGRDASDWSSHFKLFQENGFDGGQLWAITFDNTYRTHNSLATQLEDFIVRIQYLTKATTISLVSHSLSVTVSRLWLEQYDRYSCVDVFVGLAGANHGLPTCPPKAVTQLLPASHTLKPCQELTNTSTQTTQISRLNQQVGETPGDIKYYTIRGSYDSYFVGNKDSPILGGAEENILLNTDHNGTKDSAEAMAKIYRWVSQKE